ncbi:hypothetical protein MAR_007341 [Mya arenaria]|uniref:Uncharacterized protein n=1 Tax=Mya arenaria TaxID=6604 RepID=A0ABY7DEU6_MYAAR|nr:hypothetical protein MAR_007341 [Mya arenaria]
MFPYSKQQGQQGFQQQQRMQGIPAQPFGQGPDSQVQMVALQGQIQPQFQGQSAVFQGQNAQPGMAAGNMQPDMSNIVPLNPQQNFQPQAIDQRQGQMQGQVSVGGRRKRHDDPDCKRLEDNPDKYCRKFEPECHNCTLEKRLRFEVCGEGVERARDEIKRIDESVANYLKAYNEYVAKEKLVFKVEYNSKNRLRKTTSYFDAMITAKVGPSVFTFKSKMIINIKDVRATGSQIGDEIWEKLWENEVFAEAKEILLPIRKENILGQAQVKDVHSAHAQTNPTGGSQSIVPSCSAIMCAILSTVVLLL